MDAGPPEGADGPAPWGDLAWWTEQIDQALATRDPVLANLRITQTHYQLSLALRTILGPPDDGRGSQAGDGADLRERMHYICALFCTGQDDPTLFRAPYTAAQCAAIATGRIPRGAL